MNKRMFKSIEVQTSKSMRQYVLECLEDLAIDRDESLSSTMRSIRKDYVVWMRNGEEFGNYLVNIYGLTIFYYDDMRKQLLSWLVQGSSSYQEVERIDDDELGCLYCSLVSRAFNNIQLSAR